jgi:hypothetical protein
LQFAVRAVQLRAQPRKRSERAPIDIASRTVFGDRTVAEQSNAHVYESLHLRQRHRPRLSDDQRGVQTEVRDRVEISKIPVGHVALHDLKPERGPSGLPRASDADDDFRFDPRPEQRPRIDARHVRKRFAVDRRRELRLRAELRANGAVGESHLIAYRRVALRDTKAANGLGDLERVALGEMPHSPARRFDQAAPAICIDERRRDRIERCRFRRCVHAGMLWRLHRDPVPVVSFDSRKSGVFFRIAAPVFPLARGTTSSTRAAFVRHGPMVDTRCACR